MNLDLFVAEVLAPQKESFPPVGDFHTANAIAFYGYENIHNTFFNDYKTFKEDLRDKAKRTGLALLYGGSHRVVQSAIGLNEPEAKEIYNRFFSTIHGFSRHVKTIEQRAIKTGYTKNLMGTILHIPQIQSKDFREKAEGLRHLQNYPIQSIAANLIQFVILQIHNLIENAETSNLCGDNINTQYYNRIYISSDFTDQEQLIQDLDQLPDGNILVILPDDTPYNRYVALTQQQIDNHTLTDILDIDEIPEQYHKYLYDLQQNMLILFHTIHDEIDIIVDSNLHRGISKRLTEIGAAKNLFDKIGIPYINYLYDVEPNSDGSFIPNKKDVVNINYTQGNDLEYKAYKELKETTPDIETITIEAESTKDIKEVIKYSYNGIRLLVKTPKKTHIVPRLVDKQSIKDFIKG